MNYLDDKHKDSSMIFMILTRIAKPWWPRSRYTIRYSDYRSWEEDICEKRPAHHWTPGSRASRQFLLISLDPMLESFEYALVRYLGIQALLFGHIPFLDLKHLESDFNSSVWFLFGNNPAGTQLYTQCQPSWSALEQGELQPKYSKTWWKITFHTYSKSVLGKGRIAGI